MQSQNMEKLTNLLQSVLVQNESILAENQILKAKVSELMEFQKKSNESPQNQDVSQQETEANICEHLTECAIPINEQAVTEKKKYRSRRNSKTSKDKPEQRINKITFSIQEPHNPYTDKKQSFEDRPRREMQNNRVPSASTLEASSNMERSNQRQNYKKIDKANTHNVQVKKQEFEKKKFTYDDLTLANKELLQLAKQKANETSSAKAWFKEQAIFVRKNPSSPAERLYHKNEIKTKMCWS